MPYTTEVEERLEEYCSIEGRPSGRWGRVQDRALELIETERGWVVIEWKYDPDRKRYSVRDFPPSPFETLEAVNVWLDQVLGQTRIEKRSK